MDTSEVAQGCFLNFQKSQTEDGTYPHSLFPHIVPDALPQRDFIHAHWGQSILAVHALHPNNDFLKKAYDSLVKYARYCDAELDREESGLYDVQSQCRMGRGFFLRRNESPPDKIERSERDDHIRLKGVDATVDMYCTKKALSILAHTLGKIEEADTWEDAANAIKQAVLDMMWDPSDEMFYDVDPRTQQRTKRKAVTCFYPYTTDIVDERHIRGLKHHLFNPAEFWTPYPVASLSRDDPDFNAEAEWRGKRHPHPWNGRVWPIANCHIVEALVNSGSRIDESLTSRAVELLTTFIHMMFTKDDVRFPHSHEHFNPISGKPSLYRGLNDVQGSWMVDLIVKYVAGVQPQVNGGLVIDPLPFEIRWLRLDRIPFRGHVVNVEIEGEDISLYVDGALKACGKRGEKIEMNI